MINLQWRTKKGVTNEIYLKRRKRKIKFFEGTLDHLNEYESLKKRKRQLNKKLKSDC